MLTSRSIAPRDGRANPQSGNCKLALQRICGVCCHHTGVGIRDTGECHRHVEFGVSGLRSASGCDDFERPTVAAVKNPVRLKPGAV